MSKPFVPTVASVDDLAHGRITLTRLGQSFPGKLSPDGWNRFRAAMRDGFCRYGRGNYRGSAIENVWFYYCEARQVPYCHLYSGSASWDLIAMNAEVTEDGQRAIEAIWRALRSRCKRGTFFSGSVSGGVAGVPVAVAEQFISEVTKALPAYLRQRHPMPALAGVLKGASDV